jgi:hypothetical protein
MRQSHVAEVSGFKFQVSSFQFVGGRNFRRYSVAVGSGWAAAFRKMHIRTSPRFLDA